MLTQKKVVVLLTYETAQRGEPHWSPKWFFERSQSHISRMPWLANVINQLRCWITAKKGIVLFAFIYNSKSNIYIGLLLFELANTWSWLHKGYSDVSFCQNKIMVSLREKRSLQHRFVWLYAGLRFRFVGQLRRMVSLVGLVNVWPGLHSPPSKVLQSCCRQNKSEQPWPAMSWARQRRWCVYWWLVRKG